jgi:long-chain fatty acid transport protein
MNRFVTAVGAILCSTTSVHALGLDRSAQDIGFIFEPGGYANIRHAKYSQTMLSPDFFNRITDGASITDLADGTSYKLGIGRRLNDAVSVSVAVSHEPASADTLVSPLTPTNGRWGMTLDGRYTVDKIEIGAGISYTIPGDARPALGSPDVQQAEFTDNDELSLGITVAYRY